MLAPRIVEFLVTQHGQRTGNTLAGGVRHDDVVDEATGASHERVGELFLVLGLAGSFFSSRKMISTAPFGPMTAISADGQAILTSPRRCLDDITS